MNPRMQAILWRFLLGTLVVEIPVLTGVLSQPNPDYKLLAIGLLGGLATSLEKYFAPQLADVSPDATLVGPKVVK